MERAKADMMAQLERKILSLQGFKPSMHSTVLDLGLGPIKYAFPNHSFPLGAVHEFLCNKEENAAATCGFMSGLIAALMQNGGTCLWINAGRTVFPPALRYFGIAPDKIIFIDLKKEKEILWTIEEALRCNALTAVIGELNNLSFLASRRLQLAVEQSKVTGFILRRNFKPDTTATIARWQITHLTSEATDDLPGVGFPRWNVELLKIRNGKPGSWRIEWVNNSFKHIDTIDTTVKVLQKKTG